MQGSTAAATLPTGAGDLARSPSQLAHLRVAADAARRVGAGLGTHSQRARPVEAQAALVGRQESGQVLVARERLRVVASAEDRCVWEGAAAGHHGDARRGWDPSPHAHLAHGCEAADVHRVGAWTERHAERRIPREEDIVVAAGHALGVHGDEAARLGLGAPQVWVKPGEAVRIAEEQRGPYGGTHQPTPRTKPALPGAPFPRPPSTTNHATSHAHLSHQIYKRGPSQLLQH